MLVLTRRVGSSIMIGDDVELVVCAIHDSKGVPVKNLYVKFGLTADKEIKIHRREIWERIKKEQEELLEWQMMAEFQP
jgi:carbon storage regulator